ncbi:hypothetical protein [Allorhodopirellula solitaria]|uniref:1,4-alpha-glucan branching enzyme n=1 Tax=Allorhodopirellula solitaria TaxID=2527987 RepID=A0A5C5WRC2_9BACT|nr:hypothetical protein [Allorhodopirellula solitaria]TWT52362.1 hypothetical protein CA85_50160 [Allorhodopirellula solitaria]
MSANTQTTHHDTIRLWIEDRGGKPAAVASTHSSADVGLLRVWFPGQGSGGQLEEISWEDFFVKFEESKLAFLYEIHAAEGDLSRFCKFIARD